MAFYHIMAIIYIKRVGSMPHSGCGTKETETLSTSRNTELSGLHSLGQTYAVLELLAMGTHNQRHHQVNAAYDRAFLYGGREFIPLCLQYIMFNPIICCKIHKSSFQ